MAVKFLHRLTGSVMYVAEERAEEYKAAGHTIAADVAPVKTEPKPRTRKKTVKK